MNGNSVALPLSPPISPLMTNNLALHGQSWAPSWTYATKDNVPTSDRWQAEQEHGLIPTQQSHQSRGITRTQTQPMPQWSKEFIPTYKLATVHDGNMGQQRTNASQSSDSGQRGMHTSRQWAKREDMGQAASKIASPPDLAPPDRSARYSIGDDVEVEDGDIECGDAEQDCEPQDRPLTVAELRAHNRRLKRFRLTHGQTRYLMSEFAKQPRPDAAYRERLSREIPGLSSRQVQVWFQNRRAKLKRLTNDDREHMTRSRALPANFDMSHALHSPFAVSKPAFETPSAPLAHTTPTYDPNHFKWPPTDTSQRVPIHDHRTSQHESSSRMNSPEEFKYRPKSSASQIPPPSNLLQTYRSNENLSNIGCYGPHTDRSDQAYTNSGTPDTNLRHCFSSSRGMLWSPKRADTYSGMSPSNLSQGSIQASRSPAPDYTILRAHPLLQQRNETIPKGTTSNNSSSYISTPFNNQEHYQYALPDMGASSTIGRPQYRRDGGHSFAPRPSDVKYDASNFGGALQGGLDGRSYWQS